MLLINVLYCVRLTYPVLTRGTSDMVWTLEVTSVTAMQCISWFSVPAPSPNIESCRGELRLSVWVRWSLCAYIIILIY